MVTLTANILLVCPSSISALLPPTNLQLCFCSGPDTLLSTDATEGCSMKHHSQEAQRKAKEIFHRKGIYSNGNNEL